VLVELYRRACEGATGALECAAGTIHLRSGWVRAVVPREASAADARLGSLLRERLGPAAELGLLRILGAQRGPLGRALVDAGVALPGDVDWALRRQTELRLRALLAAGGAAGARFEAGAAARAADVSRPFDPLPWLRQVAFCDPPAWPGRVRACPAPPPRALRAGENALAAQLALGVPLGELGPEARPLLGFLQAVEALHPLRTEGEADQRRALRRQLAALHPDAHPDAGPVERARLAARFAALCEQYRRLGG
jgi:hypothetical protein